jgi:succinoglycan biosynthesis transport protein ExoP
MAEDFLDEKPTEKLDLEQYWRLAHRRCWYFFLPLFVGWLLVFAAIWILPPVYRSGTLILVEQPTVPQQYVVPNVSSDLQSRLNSITQQILSRTRLLHIIDTLNLYQKERRRLTPDDLVDQMRKDIDIELVRSPEHDQQLTAFNIYFAANDPQVAQRVTAELTNLFIDENLEARQQQSENTTQFLESQLRDARQKLTEQENQVRAYKDRYLGELPGQLQSNLQILTGFQQQLQAEEDALGRAKQQNAYFESLLTEYRNITASLKPGDDAPTGLPAIDQELDRLRTQMADLKSHYTDRHPDVRKLKEQIDKNEKMRQEIAADLKAKAKNAPKDDGSEPNITGDMTRVSPMLEVQSQLKANQFEITNRQEAIKAVQAKISEYQGRLNQTPVREQQLADLSRDYEQSKTNYESLLAKKNQSELATNLEKRQQGEHFRIVDPPSLPQKPNSPNRLKLNLIGVLVGVVLGLASATGAELTDDRVYSEKDFKLLAPTEILIEVPPLTTIEEEKSQQRKAWRDLAGVSLLVICIMAGIAVTYLRN